MDNEVVEPLPSQFSFSQALELLKVGYDVRRDGWRGRLTKRGDNLLMEYPEGKFSVHILSNGDILAEDWQIA